MKLKINLPMNTLNSPYVAKQWVLLSLWAALLVGLLGCREQTQTEENGSLQRAELLNSYPIFRMVEIPSMLIDPVSRTAYLVSHYWDHFRFSDTTYIHLPEITEQALANYLSVLPHTYPQIAANSMQKMLQRAVKEDASHRFYTYLLSRYKAYLADSNSPLRNEELYIPVLEFVLNDSISNEATKARAEYDLKLLLKNRVGTTATDFTYATATQKGKLSALQSNYPLLYFYNPDCYTCEGVTAYLRYSAVMAGLVEQKQLTILAVYPEEDLSVWKKHQGELPANWINAYDPLQQLNNKQLYDLKAMPTLYLLNRQKQVLLKDATAEQVELFLSEQMNR